MRHEEHQQLQSGRLGCLPDHGWWLCARGVAAASLATAPSSRTAAAAIAVATTRPAPIRPAACGFRPVPPVVQHAALSESLPLETFLQRLQLVPTHGCRRDGRGALRFRAP